MNSISEYVASIGQREFEFSELMQLIDQQYVYQPVSFSNGIGVDQVSNHAGQNEGSCKLFAFAQLNDLSKEQTLLCFGKYYRDDVLKHPHGNDHANIRTFMKYGWEGITFEADALTLKT